MRKSVKKKNLSTKFSIAFSSWGLRKKKSKSTLLRKNKFIFFPFDATAPILALAYLHKTFRFTSLYYILDSR
jgi:hypothetical protein